MDPITQGALGAAASQALLGPSDKRAWWLGALGGMAADLDVLIRSSSSPMLGIIYHRHFTHSLLFVPLGGLLVALPWLYKHRHNPKLRPRILAATTAGYATHALLDAFTSYGTLLWWPLSHDRVAWSVIAIIDPRYTVPLLLGVALTRKKNSRFWVLLALAWSLLYMAVCAYQRNEALQLQDQLIHARGAPTQERDVFPQMGSSRRWRSIYRTGSRAQVDELWLGWTTPSKIAPGESRPLLNTSKPPNKPGPHDVDTLRWFGKTWLYEHSPSSGNVRWWCDGRLSLRANAFDPVFCFEMAPDNRAIAKVPVRVQGSVGETLRLALWPSPDLRPAKEVLEEAKPPLSEQEPTTHALVASP